MEVPMDALMQIEGRYYKQTDMKDVTVGDVIFDTFDCSYGECDTIHDEDHIAIRDENIVELNVPKKRCRKLVKLHFSSPAEASIELNAEILGAVGWKDEMERMVLAAALKHKTRGIIHIQTFNGAWYSDFTEEGLNKLKNADFYPKSEAG